MHKKRSNNNGLYTVIQSPTRSAWLAALCCAIVAEIVYLKTLSPTVSIGDGGELVTAAATLGIAHPPGYPLWCMLGKLFSILPVGGDVAYRINVGVSLYAALGCGLLVLIVAGLTNDTIISFIAGMTLAASRVLWSQAVIPEVYTLTLVTFLLCLALFLSRNWPLLALCMGLGLGAHNTVLLALPVFLICYLKERKGIRHGVLCLLLFLVGLSVYLYLPLRAAAHPPLNWGDPSNLSRFVAHVTRRQYGGFLFPPLRTVSAALAEYCSELFYQFTPLNFAVLLIGIAAGRGMPRYAATVWLFLLLGPVYALLLSGLLRGEQLLEMNVYYIPSFAVAAIFVAYGWRTLLRSVPQRLPARSIRIIVPAVFSITVLCLLKNNYPYNDKSRNYIVYDYGKALLGDLADGAVLYAQGDYEFFPAIYLQKIERFRPDILVLDVNEPDGDDVYGYPAPSLNTVMQSDRPIYTTLPTSFFPMEKLVPAGLAFRFMNEKTRIPPRRNPPAPRYDAGLDPFLDYFEKAVLCHYHEMKARSLFAAGKRDEAVKETEIAAGYAAGNYKTLNNLGNLLAEQGLTFNAVSLWKGALAVKPDYTFALNNLGDHYYREGNRLEAVELWDRSLRSDPSQRRIAEKLTDLIGRERDHPPGLSPRTETGNVYASADEGKTDGTP